MRIIFGGGLSNLVVRCWGSLAVPRHAPLMPSALLPHTIFNLTAFDDKALKRLHIQACKNAVTVSKGFPSAIQKPGLQNPILSQFLKLKVIFLTEDIYLFYFFWNCHSPLTEDILASSYIHIHLLINVFLCLCVKYLKMQVLLFCAPRHTPFHKKSSCLRHFV